MQYKGVLSDSLLRELVSTGEFITGSNNQNIRVGSIDLSLSGEAYRVSGAFLPSKGEKVKDALIRVGCDNHDISNILERNCSYVFRLNENIKELPDRIYGYCNPKSSSGRVDIHVRTLVDGVSRYDVVPEGYKGPIYVIVSPKSFPVKFYENLSLNQLRLFNGDTRFDELRLSMRFDQNGGLLCKKNGEVIKYNDIVHSDKDGSVILTLGLDFNIPGFEALDTNEIIDFSKIAYYDPRHFFREVNVHRSSILLSPNRFYILSSDESVRVPVDFACEMRPMDERSGEFRSHYAGYIDSGWGIGTDGNAKGRPLTLEVRSQDSNLVVCHGQPVAKVRFERMVQLPQKHYDQMNSNYTNQDGPRFAKFFKNWK